jgi:hypothetical protein
MSTAEIASIIPAETAIERHLTVNGTKTVDVCLAKMRGETHLIQVVDGKWSGIRTGQSAVDNYESILAKAPNITVHA